jgi:hypothetical protein
MVSGGDEAIAQSDAQEGSDVDSVCVLGPATQSAVSDEASVMKIVDNDRVLDEDHRLHALFSLSPRGTEVHYHFSLLSNSRQLESRETNDYVSLFIDICYIFIGNELSCPFQYVCFKGVSL